MTAPPLFADTTEHESSPAEIASRRLIYGHAPFEYWMLPPLAQRDEFETRPPSEWKHRQLVHWIAEDTDSLNTLALERGTIESDLATANGALAKARQKSPYNRHDIQVYEDRVIRLRASLNQNAEDQERLRRHIHAWKLRHTQGVVECGFDNLIGEDV